VVFDSTITLGFKLLQAQFKLNTTNHAKTISLHSTISIFFSEMALNADLGKIFEIGRTFCFSSAYIVNIIILHGGYHRLLESKLIYKGYLRFIDSLYNPPYPPLLYNVVNEDICAPWVTLGAQEALLDFALNKLSVIEYGSGISTFFFARNCLQCISFESDSYPEGGRSWTNEMEKVSGLCNVEITLIKPNGLNTSPKEALKLLNDHSSILINIDGEDRTLHFTEWSEWIAKNKSYTVTLMIDNAEYQPFVKIFQFLASEGAYIFHHYGNVYGQSIGKQCTSFVTFRPEMITEGCSAPNLHDARWGRMETQ